MIRVTYGVRSLEKAHFELGLAQRGRIRYCVTTQNCPQLDRLHLAWLLSRSFGWFPVGQHIRHGGLHL
jgi:hypothetical protein